MASVEAQRRHLNRDERRALAAAEIQNFVAQYGRKALKGGLDPNDRHFSRDVERLVKRMDPSELDALLRDDEA